MESSMHASMDTRMHGCPDAWIRANVKGHTPGTDHLEELEVRAEAVGLVLDLRIIVIIVMVAIIIIMILMRMIIII